MLPAQIIRSLPNHVSGWLVRRLTSLLVRMVQCMGQLLFWWKGWKREKQELHVSKVKRALVVRLDEIGDAAMNSAFLRELRRLLPGARITLVVKPIVHDLVEFCPHVDEVLVYEPGAHRLARPFLLPWRGLRMASRHLWPRHFDLAIVPRWDIDNTYASFLAFLSGARRRVGYSESVNPRKSRLNCGFDRLFTQLLRDAALRHEVERGLEVVRFLGGAVQQDCLELWLTNEDDVYAREVLEKNGVRPGEVCVAFGPSGGHSNLRQWPFQNFVELGNRLLAGKACSRILIVGGPGEEDLGRQLREEIGPQVINVVGNSLRQMGALLKQCHLYVGTDTGPMHVAAAAGTPVVALFGSSCPHRFGPWGRGHAIVWHALPCSPCFDTYHRVRCSVCIFDQPQCIQGIAVDEVEQTVRETLCRQRVDTRNLSPS